jgi:hypothetical protein
MKIPIYARPTFDTVLDWFLEFQYTTKNAVCEVRMPKQVYTKVLKLSEPLLIEDTLYGATLTKDNSLTGEVEIVGC